jgi:hypothetical protein
MAKRGRPSKYSEALADEICKRLSEGESLNSICKMDGFPSMDTVHNWLHEGSEYKESFFGKYTRARDIQADYYADEIINIADTETDPNKARVRVDARKWVASKLKPKRYGDKLELASDDDHPLKIDISLTLDKIYGNNKS